MTILAADNPTLQDLASRQDPDGSIAMIAEMLRQTNDILDDMTWQEGNLDTGHKSTIRTGLPVPTWRKLYGGVDPTKSKTAQVTDTTGMMEMYSQVDKALADLGGRAAAFRLSEDRASIQGMSNDMAEKLFKGNEALNPEQFTGLGPRFNSLSAANGDNIIDAGGTGSDNRSIWLVGWSPDTCFGIVPKGSQTGLQIRDLGEDTYVNSDGSQYQIYRTHMRWDAGLCVKDWRYVVRIANIDKSDLTYNAASGANLPRLMFEAIERIPEYGSVRPAFYMSRDVRTFLRQQIAYGTESSTLEYESVGGKRVAYFQEVPLRRCDVLSVDEARIT